MTLPKEKRSVEASRNISSIRFIKLGRRKDRKEHYCIDNGYLILGYHDVDHFEQYPNLDQEKIRDQLISSYGSSKGAATSHFRQIEKFYDSSENTLWITFVNKMLWWGFADHKSMPFQGPDGFTYRKIIGGWKNKPMKEQAKPLTFENISGQLLKTQGFRGTICEVKNRGDSFDLEEYTKRLIRGESIEELNIALQARNEMTKASETLLQMLHWKDFEYVVDLVFQYSGWKKQTPAGGVESDLDLDLLTPLTGERAFVQVKSQTNRSEFLNYVKRFSENPIYDRMFYVYHSSKDQINIVRSDKPIHIIDSRELAELVVDLGLTPTLFNKVS